MIVIPVNIEILVYILVIASVFEILRILIAFALARPSGEANLLEIQKFETQVEISKIKSVQLELVKHSKLNRNLIKIEKQLEKIQAQYAPKALLVKKNARILRALVYVGFGIYFWNNQLVLINPQVLWPVSWFTASDTISLPASFLLFVFGGAIRHILRSVLPLLFSKTVFP